MCSDSNTETNIVLLGRSLASFLITEPELFCIETRGSAENSEEKIFDIPDQTKNREYLACVDIYTNRIFAGTPA